MEHVGLASRFIVMHATKEHNMIRTTFMALVAGTLALSAAACNTVEGAGEDLQSASREVKEEI